MRLVFSLIFIKKINTTVEFYIDKKTVCVYNVKKDIGGKNMVINKEKYSLCLDDKGKITSLKSGGKEFICEVMPLFNARLRKNGKMGCINSDMAQNASVSEKGDEIIIKYSGFEKDITFEARIVLKDRIEWYISFENNTGFYVEWIDYPQIAVPKDLVRNGGSGYILSGWNEGLLVDDADLRPNTSFKYYDPEYPGVGLCGVFPAVVETQFMAYYDDICGLYFAAEDASRSYKGCDFYPVENGVKLQFRLYPGVGWNVESFGFDYPIVTDFFKGDRNDACELYRTWFENNLPEGLQPAEQSADLPEWYFDSPLIVTYPVQGIHDMDVPEPNRLFPYENALPYLEGIAKETDSRVMSLLMHREGTAPWAPPYVWPPLGGEEMLADYCKKLHERNFLLGVYCSGAGFTVQSNLNDYNCEEQIEKENLMQYMCAPDDGSEIRSFICQGQRKSYDMCVSQKFTKDVLVKEAEKMASCGLDYIQILDQNHGGTPYVCYSDKHGHPAVPGKWMVDSMKDILAAIKNAVGDNVVLGCESAAAESYIPYLKLSDNRFNLCYHVGIPVPVYAYVFHKYLHNFSGNSVSSLDIIDIAKSPDCHLMRVAHSFLAGDLMTLVINQDGQVVWSWGERDFSVLPERKPLMDFVRQATAYRRGCGKKYLVTGEMIKPNEIKCEKVKMHKKFFEYFTEFPAVLTTAWRACDGKTAQFLANYLKDTAECEINIPESGARLVDEKGNTVKTLEGGMCKLAVPGNSVVMLEF